MQEAAEREAQPAVDAAAGTYANRKRLPLGMKLAYGLPALAGAGMGIPIAINMTKFYSDNVGVALGFIALGQAVARVFDAISRPVHGLDLRPHALALGPAPAVDRARRAARGARSS